MKLSQINPIFSKFLLMRYFDFSPLFSFQVRIIIIKKPQKQNFYNIKYLIPVQVWKGGLYQ